MRTMIRFLFGLACGGLLSALAAGDSRSLRVALFADEGAGQKGITTVRKQLVESGNVEVVLVKGNDIAGGGLAGFDVVVFPGGSGSKQGNALGAKGRENVRQFVREGGGYLGICAGAYLACTGFSWGVGVLDAKTVSPKWRRGAGVVEVEVTPTGADITGLATGINRIRYANGPILTRHGRDPIPPYEPIAFFRTELAKNDTPVGVMVNAPAIVRGVFGQGRVIVSSPHPESTDALKPAFAPSAVRWVAGARQSAPPAQ